MSDDASMPARITWNLTSAVAGMAGAVVAKKLSNSIFAAVSSGDVEPPLNPADRRVDWPDALSWAVAAGVGAAFGRLLSQRAAAAAWESKTGSTPPGIA